MNKPKACLPCKMARNSRLVVLVREGLQFVSLYPMSLACTSGYVLRCVRQPCWGGLSNNISTNPSSHVLRPTVLGLCFRYQSMNLTPPEDAASGPYSQSQASDGICVRLWEARCGAFPERFLLCAVAHEQQYLDVSDTRCSSSPPVRTNF